MKTKAAVLASVLFAGCVGGATDSATSSKSQAVSGSIDSVHLPTTFLQNASAIHGEGALGDHGHHASFAHGVPNIDSIVNFTGSFSTPGVDGAGNPQTTWPFAMVGKDPARNEPTFFRTPIVPITVELLDSTGAVAQYNGMPLRFTPGGDTVDATIKSRGVSPGLLQLGHRSVHRPDDAHAVLDAVPAPPVQRPLSQRPVAAGPAGQDDPGAVRQLVLLHERGGSARSDRHRRGRVRNALFPPTATDTASILGALETGHQIHAVVVRPGMDDTARTESLTEVRQVLGLRIVGELGLLLSVEMVEVAEELVEAVHGRQILVAVAEVVLAELTGRVTVRFQRGRDGGVLRLQTYRRPPASPPW